MLDSCCVLMICTWSVTMIKRYYGWVGLRDHVIQFSARSVAGSKADIGWLRHISPWKKNCAFCSPFGTCSLQAGFINDGFVSLHLPVSLAEQLATVKTRSIPGCHVLFWLFGAFYHTTTTTTTTTYHSLQKGKKKIFGNGGTTGHYPVCSCVHDMAPLSPL